MDAEELESVYEVPYGKKGSLIYIELHKSLFPPESEAYGDLNRFFANVHEDAIDIRIDGTDIRTMGYTAYSVRTAHPFRRNGAPFRFKLSKAQQVD